MSNQRPPLSQPFRCILDLLSYGLHCENVTHNLFINIDITVCLFFYKSSVTALCLLMVGYESHKHINTFSIFLWYIYIYIDIYRQIYSFNVWETPVMGQFSSSVLLVATKSSVWASTVSIQMNVPFQVIPQKKKKQKQTKSMAFKLKIASAPPCVRFESHPVSQWTKQAKILL